VAKRTIFLIVVSFLLAIALTFLFAFRAGRNARYIRFGQEPIRAWMNVPFIAHAHHVPEEALYQAIGVEPKLPRDRRPLRRIAREEKRPVDELIRELNQAIVREHGTIPGAGKGP